MKGLLSLFRFSTRLPLGSGSSFDMEEMGKSMKYFPIVGIVLGLIMYIAMKFMGLFIESSLLVALLTVLLYVVLTGGIHLDGLSDTFDGIFSYRSKQKMLEIMKDSRVGANGAIALSMYFILATVLLSETETMNVPMESMILIFPVVGRMNSVLNCAVSEYARSNGMAKLFVEKTTFSDFMIAFFTTIIYVAAVVFHFNLSWNIVLMVPLTGILGYYFARVMKRKIGGITGDTLGAVLELSQLTSILLVYFLR